MVAHSDSVQALGELRGMLSVLAWANDKCNHNYTFTIEELSVADDPYEPLVRHFGEWAGNVTVTPLDDWRGAVEGALHRWLFQFGELVKPEVACSLTDEESRREMANSVMNALAVGLQPVRVWRVEIEPRGFYECAWDDFAIRGRDGIFLLHLGVSD